MCKIHRKIPVFESRFNRVLGLETCNFNHLLLALAKFFEKSEKGLKQVHRPHFQHDLLRKIFLTFYYLTKFCCLILKKCTNFTGKYR